MHTITPSVKNIPEANVDALRERLDKLLSRAARKGLVGAFAYTFGEPIVSYREIDEVDPITRERVKIPVRSFPLTLSGDAPCVGGWTFAATVEPLDGSPIPLMQVSPLFDGGMIPVRYRTGNACACEHCEINRKRSETFIVYHAERNEFKQVGRQCLIDFLGHDPSALIAWFSFVSDASAAVEESEEYHGGSRTARVYALDELLRLTARVVVVDGWKSRSAWGMESTSSMVQTWISARETRHSRDFAAELDAKYVQTERSEALAARARVHLDTLATKEVTALDSDYERNLLACTLSGFVSWQHIGLTASILAWALRQENDELQRAQRPDVSASKHVGTIGERVRGIVCTCTFTRIFEGGQFGAKTLVKLIDPKGNALQWWASGVPDIAAGYVVAITGTVKAHEQDKYAGGAACTLLSRCKFERVTA